MEKLLYLTWHGKSPEELRRDAKRQEERIESRRKSRIKMNAGITITHPTAQDFDGWFGVKKSKENNASDS